MIEVQNLTKRYGDRLAIEALNFSVKKGDVVGFLGPNGAGKSTTMKIITGFMAPSEGRVTVAGLDVFENPVQVKEKIGYLPENPPVYNDMYVRDYLRYVGRLKGVSRQQISGHVDRALEKTSLQSVHKRLIGNLSKGFKQRVGIAQALVADPEILILDEPTVGLDPTQVADVRSLIGRLKGHHTIVLSTHILPEVQASCDRIIIINNGVIIAQDTLEGLGKRMTAAQRVELKVKRSSADFLASLKSVAGVQGVAEQGDGFVVDTIEGDEPIEAIAKLAVNSDVGLLQLNPQSMNLEDIFIKLTSESAEVQ